MEDTAKIRDVAPHRPKWEVYSDDHGNMYFYNTTTEETAWELPQDAASDNDDRAANTSSSSATPSNDSGGYDDATETISAAGDALVSNQLRDGYGNLLQLTVIKPKHSPYQVAVEVIETMLALVDAVEQHHVEQIKSKKLKQFVSPAAEKRAVKNLEIQAKKRKREHLLAKTRYMDILIPPVTTASAAVGRKRAVGALFSREDAHKWRLEKEAQQIRQRSKVRKCKDQHQQQVHARAAHHHFLKQFRIELMKYFIAQIPYSSELQQQRILLLTTPQQLAELELKRRTTFEPEILERYEAEKKSKEEATSTNIQKVFVLADQAAVGSVHLLQTLLTVFCDERAQKFANKVRGLAELVHSIEIQRFVVDFVSAHFPQEAMMSLKDFHEFVHTIAEVLEHFEGVKAAVKEAEEEIAAAMEVASKGSGGGNSLLRARLNMVPTKKVKQEMAALKAIQIDLKAKHKRETTAPFYDCSDALSHAMAKEDWEKHHHHRYIQITAKLPTYCCLCRRRKWESWRQELEQEESEFRASYANRYAIKLKSEELRLIQDQEGDGRGEEAQVEDVSDISQETAAPPENTPLISQLEAYSPFESTTNFQSHNEDDKIVLQIVRALVLMTERIHSDGAVVFPALRPVHERRLPAKQQQTGSPQKKKANKKKKKVMCGARQYKEDEELDELQMAMKQFEAEDREHKLLHIEDTAMHIYLERSRRQLERLLLLQEDTAHNAYIRLLSHCVNPCSLLNRLQFERCLAFDPPQQLVMLMADNGLTDPASDLPCRHFILHTVPCRTEREGSFIYQQVKATQKKLKSPFVAHVDSSSKHAYQLFAESGMLIECWPVVFVAEEYFPDGSWGDAFTNAVASKAIPTFARAEAKIIQTFRNVAAGLASMHSSGILHLNLNLGNLYMREKMQFGSDHAIDQVLIGGLLVYKRGFHEDQLQTGDMAHYLNPTITPPEATIGLPVSGKADAWMLGCAIYDALMIWQTHELLQRGIGNSRGARPTMVLRLKNIADVFQEIPLSTSASIRSLLRMLLQPNPSQRPQMGQIVDILSFAGKKSPLK